MADEQNSALLIIDVQKDFCAGGALAVPNGDSVVPVLNRCITALAGRNVPIYASRDWHPRVSTHFKEFGGLWPVHCVQGSRGADFHPDLRLPPNATIVSKGEGPNEDGYSDFEGHTPDGAPFAEDLRRRGISHLYVGGLATDYCVRHTVRDALTDGFQVTVISDAISGVEVRPGDSARAVQDMQQAGARFVPSEAVR